MPTKAAYLAFENEPGLEFDYFLATKLGGTVGELRDRMSNDEWGRWAIYYRRIQQAKELAEGSRR